MSLLNENVVTLVKLETTYGVDAAPTGADAVMTSRVQLTPMESQTVSRDLDKPSSGSDLEITVGVHAMIEFRVELVGSGSLGVAPAFGKLLKACRCGETIVATTSVAYRPLRSSTTSATIAFYLDGNLHKLVGARGTFRLEIDSQNIPYLVFTFTGLYVDPSAAANPVALTGWDAFKIPQPVNFANTPTPTLHGYTAVYTAFRFDAGNQVSVFNNPGEREVKIVSHAATGSITMLAPAIGTKDFFAAAKNNVLGTMQIEHGTVDEEKWFLDCAEDTVQVIRPRYGDNEGRATLEADLNFVPTAAGGDEWELRFAAA
ncbi:MAG: hypothetical protein MK141_14280 [Pseudoxanthomonas sp.]|uniref:phage tail tube protein n=1 Tax=Pseudoxanthomonas sp. TaxID=1871049 RepID=UPI00258CBBDB|nr:phage tail tube protein [Pseudoxanthomonas sp.]MCH2092727.1 hypothetical protein [Pseudoxanthomonas sp.]